MKEYVSKNPSNPFRCNTSSTDSVRVRIADLSNMKIDQNWFEDNALSDTPGLNGFPPMQETSLGQEPIGVPRFEDRGQGEHWEGQRTPGRINESPMNDVPAGSDSTRLDADDGDLEQDLVIDAEVALDAEIEVDAVDQGHNLSDFDGGTGAASHDDSALTPALDSQDDMNSDLLLGRQDTYQPAWRRGP